MEANIHDEYISWLYGKIKGRRSYANLCTYIHNRWEFYWSVEYDENRQVDGYDQRYEFLEIFKGIFSKRQREDLLNQPVSVFEVLTALIDRMDFALDDLVSGPRKYKWFLELLNNLDLLDLTDPNFGQEDYVRVDRIMQVLLDRTYDEDGTGGLFPISNPKEDMRGVELWYQMMIYLDQKHPI